MRRGPRTARAAAWALAALVTASCGTPLMKLPALPPGGGLPAPDASDSVDLATRACRMVTTLSAELTVGGSVAGRRMPRSHLIVGLAVPQSVRIEAVASVGAVFVFVAHDGDSTLVLPRDNRVLEHGQPDAVLEALTRVPLETADLRSTLTGCVVAPDLRAARRSPDGFLVVPDRSSTAYIRTDANSAPRVVAIVHRSASGGTWQAEYRDYRDGLPSAIHLASSGTAGNGRFDLSLSVSQVETNTPLDAAVFRVQVPQSAVPMTLAELRDSGPLGGGDAR